MPLLHKGLINITVANTLRNFGGALVDVFVPLILLKNGLTLLNICFFYIIYAVAKLLINYPVMRITNKYGAKASLILSRVSYIGYLLCLVAIINGATGNIIWFMALALAATNALQWNAQHLHIARVINMARKGKDIAIIDSVDMLASSLAPAISALLVLVLGASWPLYIAIL